jgi:signal transduction histidine kinase
LWEGLSAVNIVSILFSGPRRRIVTLAVMANLLAFAVIAISLEANYQQYRERAAVTSYNTNRLVSQSIAETFERIDLALQASRDEIALQQRRSKLSPQDISSFLENIEGLLPMTTGLRVTDVQGNVIASSREVPGGINYADRKYFMELQNNPAAGLVISEPIMGRIGKKWAIALARRLNDVNGKFSGIIVVSVQIDWFSEKFASLNVGPHGAVVLRGDASREFDLLARYPGAGYVGQTKVSDTFRATITANPQQGTYQAYAGADNILRTFSYQAVPGFPLITLVGLAPEDYLAPWWNEVYKMGVLAVVFVLLSVVASMVLLRTWRALEWRTEELSRSNADLEQFAYIASHDLQTPLRNIVSFTQLLDRRYKGRLDADADEFIGYIVDGAKRMSQMITDLLEYARVSNEHQDVEAVDLGVTVQTALRDLAPLVAASGAKVTVGRLPMVYAQKRRMESLFVNLLENAINYRRPGLVPELEITASPDGAGFWRIAVQDNGIGIAPEYLEKIFVIFQRLDPLKYPEGTGVGLAICRRIVERFGGRIWVESKPGQGTTFLFTLPSPPETAVTSDIAALASASVAAP